MRKERFERKECLIFTDSVAVIVVGDAQLRHVIADCRMGHYFVPSLSGYNAPQKTFIPVIPRRWVDKGK
jgi:hypothetical protein